MPVIFFFFSSMLSIVTYIMLLSVYLVKHTILLHYTKIVKDICQYLDLKTKIKANS